MGCVVYFILMACIKFFTSIGCINTCMEYRSKYCVVKRLRGVFQRLVGFLHLREGFMALVRVGTIL